MSAIKPFGHTFKKKLFFFKLKVFPLPVYYIIIYRTTWMLRLLFNCEWTVHVSDQRLSSSLQHWESVPDPLAGAHHPRDGGRGDRLLPRPGAVRALSQSCGAPVGGGGGAQRHWAVQPVPGAPATLHRAGSGGAARLTLDSRCAGDTAARRKASPERSPQGHRSAVIDFTRSSSVALTDPTGHEEEGIVQLYILFLSFRS